MSVISFTHACIESIDVGLYENSRFCTRTKKKTMPMPTLLETTALTTTPKHPI
jgi:hypothetical protein